MGSKSSSVTSFVTIDLLHNPQNFCGFMSFWVAVNFQPICFWQYRHSAIVQAYLEHIKETLHSLCAADKTIHHVHILEVTPVLRMVHGTQTLRN
jgi:hypothetical protein